MKTMGSAVFGLALVLWCTFANAETVTLTDTEKGYVLQQARDLQYNLRTAGLEELSCEVHPDWRGFFQQLGIDTTSPQSLVPLLERVHFNVNVDSDGKVDVTHTGVPSPNAGTAAAMRGALQGMDQMIGGFFKTWAMYTISSPLPSINSNYEVHPVDENYEVDYRQGSTEIRTTLDSEFAVVKTSYSSPEFSLEMHPAWDTGTYGYRLAGYDGVTQIKPGTPSHEQLQIAYHTEGELQLPERVRETTFTPNGNVQVTLEVDAYRLKRRGNGQTSTMIRASSATSGTENR